MTDWQDTIAQGTQLPGEEGALFRLLALADFRSGVDKWMLGEKVRATPPQTSLDVMAVAVASAVIAAVAHLQRHQMRQAAQDIMRTAAAIVEGDVKDLMAHKKTDAVIRNRLRVISDERA